MWELGEQAVWGQGIAKDTNPTFIFGEIQELHDDLGVCSPSLDVPHPDLPDDLPASVWPDGYLQLLTLPDGPSDKRCRSPLVGLEVVLSHLNRVSPGVLGVAETGPSVLGLDGVVLHTQHQVVVGMSKLVDECVEIRGRLDAARDHVDESHPRALRDVLRPTRSPPPCSHDYRQPTRELRPHLLEQGGRPSQGLSDVFDLALVLGTIPDIEDPHAGLPLSLGSGDRLAGDLHPLGSSSRGLGS